MDDLRGKTFTSGSFAALHNLNKKTLMYYDQIGLFAPAKTDVNGYRYYVFEQSFTLSIILILRKMGLSLKEIKSCLEFYDHEYLFTYVHGKSKQFERQLFELMWLYKEEKKHSVDNLLPSYESKNEAEQVEDISLFIFKDEAPPISKFLNDCYKYRLNMYEHDGMLAKE